MKIFTNVTKLLLNTLFLAAIASCALSVSDGKASSKTTTGSYAKIALSASIDSSARTIFPADSSADDETYFAFTYSRTDVYDWGEFSASTLDEINELISSKEFSIAEYQFWLTETLNGNNYSADITQTLELGTNTLSFNLTSDFGYGGISLTIQFDGNPKLIKAQLQDTDGNIYREEELEATNSSVTYKKSLSDENEQIYAGTYRIVIEFYGGDNNSFLLNTYKELVRIAPGRTSIATRTLDLNDVYTIEWFNNGGEIADGSQPTQYSRKSDDITLPDMKKDDYIFMGWYETAEFTGSKIESIATGSTGDKTFYARFVAYAQSSITVTFPEYSDITKADFEDTSSGSTLSLTFITDGFSDFVWEFDGTETQTGTSFTKDLSSLVAGSYDLYFEAKKDGRLYSYYMTVTVSAVPASGGTVNGTSYESVTELADAIRNLSDDTVTTLSIGSNISSYPDLHTIGDALTNKNNCSITLDLSGCTSLTALGEAFNNKQAVTKVILPASLKTIENNAFYNCQKLSEVEFANGSQLETIAAWAFYQTNITSITLPASLKSIGSAAFANTPLTSLAFADTDHTWTITGSSGTISEYDISNSEQNASNIRDSAKYTGTWTRNDD